MRRKISTYLDLEGYGVLSFTNFDDVIWRAYKDGVTELECETEDIDKIDRYFMVNSGQYNFEEKTILGIKLIDKNGKTTD